MDVEQFKVKPEEWSVIDGTWHKNGLMEAERACWYLTGYHLIRDKSLPERAPIMERVAEYTRLLHDNDLIIVLPENVGKTSVNTMRFVDKNKLISFFEKNPKYGRPPFLFAGAKDIQSIKEDRSVKGKWPWGNYETSLLRDLVAAVQEHWLNYDPKKPITAPKNETVVTWLIEERGVSANVAKVMASIIRADNLQTGVRKSKG